jgi:hypothetical protein
LDPQHLRQQAWYVCLPLITNQSQLHAQDTPICSLLYWTHILLFDFGYTGDGACIQVSLHLHGCACVAEIPEGAEEPSQDANERKVEGCTRPALQEKAKPEND